MSCISAPEERYDLPLPIITIPENLKNPVTQQNTDMDSIKAAWDTTNASTAAPTSVVVDRYGRF